LAASIFLVSATDRSDDVRERRQLPPLLKLQPTSPSTCLWCGVKIEFDLRLRKHHRTDIAAVYYHATGASKLSLLANEDGAYAWVRGHQRSSLTHGLTSNGRRDVATVNMDDELPSTNGELEREWRAETH
jgi:hypothetical protein